MKPAPVPTGAATEKPTTPAPTPALSSSAALRVELQGVCFGYACGPTLLRNLNLTLEPGTMTAISGPNGGGKSTLAYLLLGFFAPTSGVITIAADASDSSPANPTRNTLGWAPQVPQILRASVADNITLGRPANASMTLADTLALTGCETFVAELENGTQTQLGDGRALLSGGQQQRLCLARALYGLPQLLILDEALSMLPPEDELHIVQRIRTRAHPAPTLLCMTHRKHVIDSADAHWLLDGAALLKRGP